MKRNRFIGSYVATEPYTDNVNSSHVRLKIAYVGACCHRLGYKPGDSSDGSDSNHVSHLN